MRLLFLLGLQRGGAHTIGLLSRSTDKGSSECIVFGDSKDRQAGLSAAAEGCSSSFGDYEYSTKMKACKERFSTTSLSDLS